MCCYLLLLLLLLLLLHACYITKWSYLVHQCSLLHTLRQRKQSTNA
jgi:hypothetical protein